MLQDTAAIGLVLLHGGWQHSVHLPFPDGIVFHTQPPNHHAINLQLTTGCVLPAPAS
jgi:hypothetical protein